MMIERFGSCLAGFIKARRLTNQAVAYRLDVSGPYMSDVLRSRRGPLRLDQIRALKDFLMLEPEDVSKLLRLSIIERGKAELPVIGIELDEEHLQIATLLTEKWPENLPGGLLELLEGKPIKSKQGSEGRKSEEGKKSLAKAIRRSFPPSNLDSTPGKRPAFYESVWSRENK